MKFTSKQIHEMADDISSGMNVYINPTTFETSAIFDLDSLEGDSEFWKEELDKILTEWEGYIIIHKMETRRSFQIMVDFLEEIDDKKLKERLIQGLNRKGPFGNFNFEVGNSDYKQQWFEFRQMKYEQYVKMQLEMHELPFE